MEDRRAWKSAYFKESIASLFQANIRDDNLINNCNRCRKKVYLLFYFLFLRRGETVSGTGALTGYCMEVTKRL